MDDAQFLSVVVPVYNSASSLDALARRLVAALEQHHYAYEIILVNDGSRDPSWDGIRALCAAYPTVRGINLMRNYGQENALLAGVRAARGEIVITMDDDLQHPPEEIPRLLEKLAEGFDVVYGIPFQGQHGALRNFASWGSKVILESATGVDSARMMSAFRAFRTRLRDAFAECRGPYVMLDVLLTWGTTRFAAVPTHHEPRRVGRSNYNFWKLSSVGLTLLTSFSTLPLRLASLVGFVFTLFGLGALAYVVGMYFVDGGSVPGFPFLASMIAIFAGAQLFALGIFGEYLARMYLRLMERPAYTVRERAGGNDGPGVKSELAEARETQVPGVRW